MKHKHFEQVTFDAVELYGQSWAPETEPKAALLLVHGLGEHSGRYQHWAEKLTQHGYALISYDLRGHGKSAGKRGHAPSFDHHANDIALFQEKAQTLYPGLPLFIYGHSLGGLLVLYYLVQRQPTLKGAVVTSPALETAASEQKIKIVAARLLGALIPKVTIANGLELEGLSRDKAVIEAYINDPLVHNQISLKMGKDMLAAADYIFLKAFTIETPLLLMHGGADHITLAAGSEKLAQSIKADCTLKIWDGFYHELHNEPEQDEVFAFLEQWLAQHL